MKRLPEVDTVIVGGGWTGLLMAKELTAASRQVVVLERGPMRKTADYADDMDELDFAIRARMMQDIRHETITVRHSTKDRALPVRQYGSFLPGTGVGGGGEHWSGISYRYMPEAFRLRSHYRERYGEKRLPEGHALQDWGITYQELEPYYWKAEQMMGLSGKAGNLNGKKMAGGNVFEGPRSHEYPTPPMKRPYLAEMFRQATEKMGYHPHPLPAATLSTAHKNPDGVMRAGCVYCGYCERYGCMIGAKAQPTNTLLPVLAKRKNFTVRTGCWVRRVIVEGGLARGVVYVDSKGEEFLQPANTVVLASWSINNTRLLLLSKVGGPNVGRNLTHQVSLPAAMCFFEKPLNRFMGAGSAGVAIADYDEDVIDHSDLPFLGGGIIYTVCYGFRPMANFGVLPASVKATWGSEWKKAAMHWYDRTGRISFYGDHFSYRANVMDLDPTYKDRYGDPLIRMTIDWTDNERQMALWMSKKAVEIARVMGAKEITAFPGYKRYDASRYQSTHIQGGAIMGTSPENSVVSTHMQVWSVPNLYVIGASAWPQNPSVNPTLTALALTYRSAGKMTMRA
ncbi:MAG: GMC family oxidoreductase [Bryobacterales bacterium]|nr:GMC family oxidoreductase [Bryobacterales bacterium]